MPLIKKCKRWLSATLVVLPFSLVAQINGGFLNEFQLGNIPKKLPENLVTNYTRLNLNFEHKKLSFRSMSEVFTSQNLGTSYISPSQISLQYKAKHFEVKLGNAYETIGRGNLLRSYEIPGSILEDKIFRSRSYFYKDLLGGSIKYSKNNFSIKFLGGKVLDNLIAATEPISNRRKETIFALNPEIKIKKVKIGSGLMSYADNRENETFFLTNYASYNFGKNALYFEFSNTTKKSNSYSLYGSYNFTVGDFGGTIEVKDYKNFLIGTGINQPPALVREHIYRVLNRSTHVLQPQNEIGAQAEFFYSKGNHMLTLNQTLAENNFGNKFLFAESFFEYQYNYENGITFKAFVDYTNDDFKNEKNRISFGAQRDFKIKRKKIKGEFEYQTFSRDGSQITNQVYGLTLFPINNLTISPVLEISNDPFIAEKNKSFFGAYTRYVFQSKYTLQVFAGERRGGPACNAGICYEVLDFKGIEVKGVVRF